MASLRFEVKGELGAITLKGFLAAIESSFRILAEYDVAISGEPGGSLDWVVKDIATGSLILEAESVSRLENKNFGPEVARRFVKGWQQIESTGLSPAFLSDRGMKRAKTMAKLIGREGTTGFVVSGMSEVVEITAQSAVNIDRLIKPRYKSIGSVEGRLETISIHGKPRFVIYHSRTGKAVNCTVPADKLTSLITTDLLGRRVCAYGLVHSNARGEPLRVDAERIRILREKHELPSIESLGGKHPDFTGGASTVDYLRKLRGG